MRKNLVTVATAAFVLTFSATLFPADEVFKGQIVETSCYSKLGFVKATAPEHVACAKECAAKGLYLGIVTDGDGVFKILGTYAENKYAKLLDYVGKEVEITGTRTHASDYSPAIDATKVVLLKPAK
jgi:hypothetical protein